MSVFQGSIAFNDVTLLPETLAAVDQILAKARDSSERNGAITFWPSHDVPRTQIYDGPCNESIVKQLREAVGPTIKVSIVRDPSQYATYRIRSTGS